MKNLLQLTGAGVLLWGILLIPGWLIQGDDVWLQSLVALGLALLPAAATLAWLNAAGKKPEMQVVAILGGSGIRLMVTLGGAFVLHQIFPELFPTPFFFWVGSFYLGALAMEVVLALPKEKPLAVSDEPTGTSV